MNSISDIKHAFYINLDTRPDRKVHVENQLQSVGITAERFNAIRLKILENAKVNNLDHVLIVEDDILFTNPNKFVEQFNKFLSINKHFDVALIAGNNIPPYQVIDDSCIKVTKCQTTTGYLVLNHYFDTLINNYKEGISRLIREPDKHINFAIDKWWFNIQGIHNWYLITPLTVTQREDYSDIEKRSTNYSHLMLDLNKEAFFKAQAKANKYKPKLNIFS
jgi:GR25 family glycosyltransferase involved in LPS biosynthesis